MGLHEQLRNTEWNSRRLDEVLSDTQIRDVWKLYQRHQEDEVTLLHKLKEYMESIRADLDKKGVDARFLAFVLFARLTERLI